MRGRAWRGPLYAFSFLFMEKDPRLLAREAKDLVRWSHSCDAERVCGRLWFALCGRGRGGGMGCGCWVWSMVMGLPMSGGEVRFCSGRGGKGKRTSHRRLILRRLGCTAS
jgi:hypothetical protein